MKRPESKLKDVDEDVLNYIWFLEKRLEGFSEFQQELSNTLSVIASDLRLVNSGAVSGYKILSGNKDDKLFERLMTVIKMQSQIKNVALIEPEEPTIKKKKVNIQDFVARPQ